MYSRLLSLCVRESLSSPGDDILGGPPVAGHEGQPHAPALSPLGPSSSGGASSSGGFGGGGAIVPVDPAPVPPESADARTHRVRQEGDQGEAWQIFHLPEVGKLVFDPFSNSYGAHCNQPGHKQCRINRVVGKRPIGYLVAWLLDGERHATAAQHKSAKMERDVGQPLSVQKRMDARAWFCSLQNSEEFLVREPDAPDGEMEPAKL
jgi:hypothetical protein